MFSLFHIGVVEIISVLVVAIPLAVLGLFQPAAWRWLAVLSCILIIAMVCTPADPISMWFVATPAIVVFAAGVILSPWLRRPRASGSAQ